MTSKTYMCPVCKTWIDVISGVVDKKEVCPLCYKRNKEMKDDDNKIHL